MATSLTKFTKVFSASKKLHSAGLTLWRYCKTENTTLKPISANVINPKINMDFMNSEIDSTERMVNSAVRIITVPIIKTREEKTDAKTEEKINVILCNRYNVLSEENKVTITAIKELHLSSADKEVNKRNQTNEYNFSKEISPLDKSIIDIATVVELGDNPFVDACKPKLKPKPVDLSLHNIKLPKVISNPSVIQCRSKSNICDVYLKPRKKGLSDICKSGPKSDICLPYLKRSKRKCDPCANLKPKSNVCEPYLKIKKRKGDPCNACTPKPETCKPYFSKCEKRKLHRYGYKPKSKYVCFPCKNKLKPKYNTPRPRGPCSVKLKPAVRLCLNPCKKPMIKKRNLAYLKPREPIDTSCAPPKQCTHAENSGSSTQMLCTKHMANPCTPKSPQTQFEPEYQCPQNSKHMKCMPIGMPCKAQCHPCRRRQYKSVPNPCKKKTRDDEWNLPCEPCKPRKNE